MKNYSILGISLRDYQAREALWKTEGFLHSGALNTITYITARALEQAARDEGLKQLLEETDLTLCMETDILEAAGIATTGRIREIDERSYFWELLRRLSRRQEKIFILGTTVEESQAWQQFLWKHRPELVIAGCRGYEEFEDQPERLMNALNEAAPGVILSRLPWQQGLYLMHMGRRYLNAEVWVALPEKELPEKPAATFLDKFKKRMFEKRVKEYNGKKTD